MTGGWSWGAVPAAELAGAGPVGAHPVGLAGDVEHHGSVQQPVEHGGGDHRVVEDLSPGNRDWLRFVISNLAFDLLFRALGAPA